MDESVTYAVSCSQCRCAIRTRALFIAEEFVDYLHRGHVITWVNERQLPLPFNAELAALVAACL